jgi:RNA polymerase sigma factor (TIGR02999 family)
MGGDACADVTALLARWKDGDKEAFERILPALYFQLRSIAQAYLRAERPGHTLQATALVHELYLKLAPQREVSFADRQHFLAFSARMMRMILIDHARTRGRQRRGGDRAVAPLHDDIPWIDATSTEMLDLDSALTELNESDPRKVQLVELYCFLGASPEETAQSLGISRATFFREWQFIRSWLHYRLRPPEPEPRKEGR